MELLKYTRAWVKGEVRQGKIMLLLGAFLLILENYIVKSNNDFLKGLIIPVGLIISILVGYGLMQIIVRPKHHTKVARDIEKASVLIFNKEHSKAIKDDKIFKLLKKMWVLSGAVSIGLYIIFSELYYQGLSIGLMGLFLTLYILDSTLHHRLKKYLKGMESLRL